MTQARKAFEEPPSETLVGVQAQNLYLINYLNKLEFLYSDARQERKRDAKA